MAYTIECGTDYILKRIKIPDSFQNLNGILFVILY